MPRGVLILPSYYDAIQPLTDDDRLKMYDALFAYGFDGTIPDLPPHLQGFFTLIRPTLDKSRSRYDAAVENGKKGGRPPKNQSENQNKNQKQNQEYDKDKELDSEKEAAKEKEGAGRENPASDFRYTPAAYSPLSEMEREQRRQAVIAQLENSKM